MHCNTEKTTQTKINKGRENGGKFLCLSLAFTSETPVVHCPSRPEMSGRRKDNPGQEM